MEVRREEVYGSPNVVRRLVASSDPLPRDYRVNRKEDVIRKLQLEVASRGIQSNGRDLLVRRKFQYHIVEQSDPAIV